MLASDIAQFEAVNGFSSIEETLLSICNAALVKIENNQYDSLTFYYDVKRIGNEMDFLDKYEMEFQEKTKSTAQLFIYYKTLDEIEDFDFHGNALKEPDDINLVATPLRQIRDHILGETG